MCTETQKLLPFSPFTPRYLIKMKVRSHIRFETLRHSTV